MEGIHLGKFAFKKAMQSSPSTPSLRPTNRTLELLLWSPISAILNVMSTNLYFRPLIWSLSLRTATWMVSYLDWSRDTNFLTCSICPVTSVTTLLVFSISHFRSRFWGFSTSPIADFIATVTILSKSVCCSLRACFTLAKMAPSSSGDSDGKLPKFILDGRGSVLPSMNKCGLGRHLWRFQLI